MKYGTYQKNTKRLIDITFSAVLMIVATPIMLLAVISILLCDGMPVLFVQERLGRYGNIFNVYKFRSMKHKPSNKILNFREDNESDDITAIGKWLRRFRIDEIPQLLNVIRGDMSLVGPRPCLPELRDEFDKYGEKRMSVRPGCTGLAQVHGNNNLSWEERWKYDAWYAENVSFLNDLRIITKTAAVIFLGEGYFTTPYSQFIRNNRMEKNN